MVKVVRLSFDTAVNRVKKIWSEGAPCWTRATCLCSETNAPFFEGNHDTHGK